MFVMLSIHTPRPEFEAELIASMHRFGEAASGRPGLLNVTAQKDQDSGDLIGLMVWESEAAAEAAFPALRAAVAGDDFETWETGVRNFSLVEV